MCDELSDKYETEKISDEEFKQYVKLITKKFDIQDAVDINNIDKNNNTDIYHCFNNYLVERFRAEWCNKVLISKDEANKLGMD